VWSDWCTSCPLLCADGKHGILMLVDKEAAQAGASIEATAECIMGTDHCASLTEDAQMPASVSDFQAQQVARPSGLALLHGAHKGHSTPWLCSSSPDQWPDAAGPAQRLATGPNSAEALGM
jgi:hypothetical protein